MNTVNFEELKELIDKNPFSVISKPAGKGLISDLLNLVTNRCVFITNIHINEIFEKLGWFTYSSVIVWNKYEVDIRTILESIISKESVDRIIIDPSVFEELKTMQINGFHIIPEISTMLNNSEKTVIIGNQIPVLHNVKGAKPDSLFLMNLKAPETTLIQSDLEVYSYYEDDDEFNVIKCFNK